VDCWNGPGFHCEDTVDTKGNPTSQKVCVCGGDLNITVPDGISRQFQCYAEGFRNNGIRLCLIKEGFPCWPLQDQLDKLADDEGLSVRETGNAQKTLSSLQKHFCGDGICGEKLDDAGNPLCNSH